MDGLFILDIGQGWDTLEIASTLNLRRQPVERDLTFISHDEIDEIPVFAFQDVREFNRGVITAENNFDFPVKLPDEPGKFYRLIVLEGHAAESDDVRTVGPEIIQKKPTWPVMNQNQVQNPHIDGAGQNIRGDRI